VWRPAPAPACPLVPHAHGPRRLCFCIQGLTPFSCSLAGLDTTQVALQPGASAHAQAAGGAQQWHRTAAGKAATQRRFVTLLNALARGEGSEHAQTEAVYEEVCAGVAGRARWQCCSLSLREPGDQGKLRDSRPTTAQPVPLPSPPGPPSPPVALTPSCRTCVADSGGAADAGGVAG
jgi:hypothetical protein